MFFDLQKNVSPESKCWLTDLPESEEDESVCSAFRTKWQALIKGGTLQVPPVLKTSGDKLSWQTKDLVTLRTFLKLFLSVQQPDII
jgi:hypothetical protein